MCLGILTGTGTIETSLYNVVLSRGVIFGMGFICRYILYYTYMQRSWLQHNNINMRLYTIPTYWNVGCGWTRIAGYHSLFIISFLLIIFWYFFLLLSLMEGEFLCCYCCFWCSFPWWRTLHLLDVVRFSTLWPPPWCFSLLGMLLWHSWSPCACLIFCWEYCVGWAFHLWAYMSSQRCCVSLNVICRVGDIQSEVRYSLKSLYRDPRPQALLFFL